METKLVNVRRVESTGWVSTMGGINYYIRDLLTSLRSCSYLHGPREYPETLPTAIKYCLLEMLTLALNLTLPETYKVVSSNPQWQTLFLAGGMR